MGDTLNIDIVAKLIDEASGPLKSITGSIGSTAAGVALGTAAFNIAQDAVSALGNAMQSVITQTTDLGLSTKELQDQTGMTAEQASGLIAVFDRFGVDANGVSKDLGLFAKQIIAASDGSKTAAANFTNLGISVRDANGQVEDTQTVLLKVADKFQTMPDGVQKTAAAMALFGKSGKDMIPILDQGSSGIEALEVQAQKMGVVLSQDNVNAVYKNIQVQQDFNEAILGVQVALGTALMPTITDLTQKLVAFVESDKFKAYLADLTNWIKVELPKAISWLKDVGLPDAKKAFDTIAPVILDIINGIIGFIQWCQKAANAIEDFGANVELVILAAQSAFNQFNAMVANAISSVIKTISNAVGSFGSMLYNAGRDLIQGLINGVGSMVGAVGNTIKNVANGAVNTMKSILGIHSPSQVFHDMGTNIAQGLANGINATSAVVTQAVGNLSGQTVGSLGYAGVPAGAGVSSPTTNNSSSIVIQNVTLATDNAIDSFFTRLGRSDLLVSKGLAPYVH